MKKILSYKSYLKYLKPKKRVKPIRKRNQYGDYNKDDHTYSVCSSHWFRDNLQNIPELSTICEKDFIKKDIASAIEEPSILPTGITDSNPYPVNLIKVRDVGDINNLSSMEFDNINNQDKENAKNRTRTDDEIEKASIISDSTVKFNKRNKNSYILEKRNLINKLVYRNRMIKLTLRNNYKKIDQLKRELQLLDRCSNDLT